MPIEKVSLQLSSEHYRIR